MPKKFKLTTDSNLIPIAVAGTIVYSCTKPDYGCSADDSSMTGTPHISVTLDPEGDYPFFTHPTKYLTEIKE